MSKSTFNLDPLVTIADETDMRLAFNPKHGLHMRQYGLDDSDVSMYMENDSVMNLLDIKHDDVVLDVGAYIGRSARYLFHRGCREVVSIEAYANNVYILELNAADERVLLKMRPDQIHHVIGGALWQTNKLNSGRVFLNSNSKSRSSMTTYQLEEAKYVAWTNAISMLDVFGYYKPTVGVFDINGTEFDFLANDSMKNAFNIFREFVIFYNIRSQIQKQYFKWYDEYFREHLLFEHVVEPDLDVLKTGRQTRISLRLPVVYRKMHTNVIVGSGTYERKNTMFANYDGIVERNKNIREARRHLEGDE